MTLPRLLLVVLVLSALTVAVGAGWELDRGRPAPAPALAPAARPAPAAPAAPGTPGRADSAAVEVLRSWDVRRARAWARGDAPALRALYVSRSTAGRHDVAMLRAWTGRGLRVRGMRMQLLSAVVRRHTGDRIVLAVTDRLDRAVAIGRDLRVVLPRDTASARVLTLRRVTGVWRVVSVRGPGGTIEP